MSRHIKIFSRDSDTTAEIIKLLSAVSTDYEIELEIEIIENKDEIYSYCVKHTPSIMIGSLVIHEGSVPTRQQIIEWFI
ncbi:thioredoxin family protein [uncultured Tolumonas sp.]|uniref:thioredoxin family protein n=1 Tax=uncultured Tolumonas sp. TaxID=263765 RepID=UPI00292F7E50|nr:thioredoxin family protein [uncultured Tolumonas sp.]